MLNLPGGIPEEGRPVTIKVRYRGPGGVPHVRSVDALMLPVSEVEELAARRASQAVNPEQPPQLPEGLEYVIQFLARSLRDAGNPAELLCADPRDLQLLRDGLTGPQYKALLLEYRAMMRTDYPEVVTKDDVADLEAQARDFSSDDQTARA